MRPSAPPLPAGFGQRPNAVHHDPIVDDGDLPSNVSAYREHHFPAIPPPPRVPDECTGAGVVPCHEPGYCFDDHPLESSDTLPMAGAHGIGRPWSPADVLIDFEDVLAYTLRELTRARDQVTELQANGTKLLEEARTARQGTAVAVWERDTWRDKALALQAALSRLDPTRAT